MSDDQWEIVFERKEAGVRLATRHVQKMPRETFLQRDDRAQDLADALRVMHMNHWRPTFPFIEQSRFS